jgi:hypothetical protein
MPSLGRIGFRAGVAACTATLAYDIVQILQVVGILHFPVDDILIFATSLSIVVPFLFEMLALHHVTPIDRRFWTQAALIFTSMYAVFGTANYVVQLTTVIPAKLHGFGDTVRLLDQTPHSLFWDFDAIAYIAMGFATLMIIPVLGNRRIERVTRHLCVAHVVATILAGMVYFSPSYSYKLLLLGFPWAITAPLLMLFLGLAVRAMTPSESTAKRERSRRSHPGSTDFAHRSLGTHRL